MEVTINSKIADKYGLTLAECFILYIGQINVNIKTCIEALLAKGLVERNLFDEGKLVLSNNTKELLASIIVESNSQVIDKEEEFLQLAKKLQELYPRGKKFGTTYMWRGTAAEIAKKLKTLIVKYKFNFTKEQAINATKSYVQSFNGDYTKMRLLKYFILKTARDADGNINITSDFMELIENEGQKDTNQNWTTNVI